MNYEKGNMEKDTKNRIIKFRGKRVDTGEWVYGDLLQYENGEMAILENKFSQYGYEATEIFKRNKIISDTVCQFTGKTDKNKKEIYEGDIVRVYAKDRTFDIVVKWSNDSMAFMACYVDGNQSPFSWLTNLLTYELEVIGNIYDNK